MKTLLIISVFLTSLISSTQGWAWGGRGHAAICEAAVYLVQSEELKDYLKSKPHMMGHLCNIPDIYWKSLQGEARKLGDPTHYINAEKIGVPISEVPTDYKKIVELYTTKPEKNNETTTTVFSVPDELGSNWWRADQFYRLAVESAKDLKNLSEPKGFKEEQNDELPYNKAFYNMIINLGLMGHYVGDASQPFHNTSDYDGYAANQGGIHSYYEEAVVSEFGPDLVSQIVKKAKTWKSQSFTVKSSVIENMRELSKVSVAETKDVLKADPIIKPSQLKIEKGMSLKKAAERRPPSEGYKRLNKLVVKEMARSSYLLAHLWDEAYKAVGSPSIKAYRSFKYPYTTEFIKPDYF